MARRWGAPVVAEVNQGGALVRNAINSIDPSIKVFEVHAKNGKALRAEPIVLAYQQNRVHHIGYLPDLEAQMTSWIPGETRSSPDRVDACLAKGTLILTRRGNIPIEDVVVEDEVWTPSGWKRTSGSQLTARMQTVIEVEASDGSAFTATPDHVVWASGGWARVDALVYGDTLRSCRQELLLSGMESSGRGTQTALSETKGSITSVLIPRDIEVSMLPYGSSQTTQNPFPQDMSSIMSITTQTTTIPTIWSASPEKSMLHSMKKKWHLFTLKNKKSIFPESGILHQNGMDLKQAWRGIESMEKEHGRVGLLLQKYASNAGKTLRHGSILPDSVRENVLPDDIAKSTDIKMMLTAQSAEHLSSKDKEKDLSHAVVSVERLTVRSEKIDVYDIVEVEDENCFYANGILVHNCVHALTALLIKPPQGFLGGKLTAKSPAARRIPSDRGQGPSGSSGGRSSRGGRVFSVR
jgi:hypothetical protein